MASALETRRSFGRERARWFLDQLSRWGSPIDPDLDREWEQAFHDRVQERFPDDCIVGEELPAKGSWEGSGWLLDPIDGTTNLRHGLPWFCTSLAYLEHGRPVLGWVADPIRGEILEAAAGEGVFTIGSDGQPRTLELPTEVSPVVSASRRWRRRVVGWRDFLPRGSKDRLLGCTALEATAVARGSLGAALFFNARGFDIAAGWLILLEGGAVLFGRGGRGVDSWTPLPPDAPGKAQFDLITGHPDQSEWLEQLSEFAFSRSDG